MTKIETIIAEIEANVSRMRERMNQKVASGRVTEQKASLVMTDYQAEAILAKFALWELDEKGDEAAIGCLRELDATQGKFLDIEAHVERLLGRA